MAYTLGIDIGTTFTSAAVRREHGCEIVTLGANAAAVPTVVALRPDGTYLVGEAAQQRAVTEPDRVAREFKRRLGDATPILLGGAPHAPATLMSKVVAWVLDEVRRREGSAPTAVVLTHPASWQPYRRELLANAAGQVFGDVHLLSEPQAAAISYATAQRLDPGAVVAVYDLGGGTFDAALVRETGGHFELLGRPEGLDQLGGIDFDDAVLGHVSRSVGFALDQFDPDDHASRLAAARLRSDCTHAKEILSTDSDAVVPVLFPGVQAEVRINRREFEELIRPALLETTAALRRAVASAGLDAAQVDRVLLVGGSARIPLVAQLVSEQLGRPVALDAHPKHAIAMGAALWTGAASTDAGTLRVDPRVEPPVGPRPMPAAEPPRRSPIAVAGAIAAVLALVAVVAFVVVGGSGDGDGDVDTGVVSASLQALLPASSRETCEVVDAGDLAETEAAEGIRCEVDGLDVELLSMATNADLTAAFDDTGETDAAVEGLDCALVAGTAHSYDGAEATGEVACGPDRLVWSGDGDALVFGSIDGGTHAERYAVWRALVERPEGSAGTPEALAGLRGHVPTDISASCVDDLDGTRLPAAEASLSCTKGDVAMRYIQFATTADVIAAVGTLRTVTGLGEEQGTFDICPFESDVSRFGAFRGRALCGSVGGQTVIVNSDEPTAVMILAVLDAPLPEGLTPMNAISFPFPADFTRLTGAMSVTLTWSSNADLDLQVFEPDGSRASRGTPSTNGGTLLADANASDSNSTGQCDSRTESFEVVSFAVRPPPGTYRIRVVGFDVAQGACGAGDFTAQVRGLGEIQTFPGTVGDSSAATEFTFVVT